MKNSILFLTFIAVFSSCATQQNREVEEQKARVGHVHSTSDMRERMRAILENTTNLSDKEKEQFLAIHHRIVGKSNEINQEIRQLKVVLFQSLTGKNYKEKKVSYLTEKIKKLYNKKLDLMIDGFVEVKNVLGVTAREIFENQRWNFHHFDTLNDSKKSVPTQHQ